jgi:plastocyanin
VVVDPGALAADAEGGDPVHGGFVEPPESDFGVEPSDRRWGPLRWSAAVVAVAVAMVMPVLGVWAWLAGDERLALRAADPSAVPVVDVVIPAGTGERIDAGERIALLPSLVVVHVGDTIRITNEDDRGHLAGPFFVGAGETLRQTFAAAGEVTGECSIHPSGEITIDVRP